MDLVLERLAVSCASVRSCFSPLDSNERARRASFSRGVLSYFLSSSLVSARQASAKMPGGNHAAFVGNRRGVRCADVRSSHPLSETTETENGARRHVLEGVFARGSHLSKRRGRGPAALLHGLMAPVSHLCHFAPLGGKRWRHRQERSVIITQSNSNNRRCCLQQQDAVEPFFFI